MNIDLPNPLRPINFIPTELPSGRSLNLPHCYPIFPAWTKSTGTFLFGGKQLLNCRGDPVLPNSTFCDCYKSTAGKEHGFHLLVAESACATCQWMPSLATASNCDLTTKKFWTKLHPRVAVALMFSRGEVTMSSFANAERGKRDEVQDTQLRWIDAALHSKLNNFLVVQWDIWREAQRNAREVSPSP